MAVGSGSVRSDHEATEHLRLSVNNSRIGSRIFSNGAIFRVTPKSTTPAASLRALGPST